MATDNGRSTTLYFDPDSHPDDTLKAFNEFIQSYELRYEAQYPDPPKVSLDSAIERWKFTNPDTKFDLEQYDVIREEWRSKDKVAKLLGMFSSKRMYEDWKVAEPNEQNRKKTTWREFVDKIQKYYKPTENLTLKNHQFRTLIQATNETFPAFCNRVCKEAKHCNFKCEHEDCTAESTAIRDQIIIGTINDKIREEALKNAWGLEELRREGMHIESAAKGVEELSGENMVNKMGKYSYKNMNKKPRTVTGKPRACYYCGQEIKGSIIEHLKNCRAKTSKCNFCNAIGHYESVCRKKKTVNEVKSDEPEKVQQDEVYNINLFRITEKSQHTKDDFKVQLIINNSLATVLADTGANISVCGIKEAERWNLVQRMVNTNTKIKPYNSATIPVVGISKCAVSFGNSSVPVDWHIINSPCEPVLAGQTARHLGIIKFEKKPDVFQPVRMIQSDEKEALQDILKNYPENFVGLGRLRNHQVKLHVDQTIKPIAAPARSIPYHLKERVEQVIEEMVKQDVIEEHPSAEPAPWVSNIVIAPKSDGSIRMTDRKSVV